MSCIKFKQYFINLYHKLIHILPDKFDYLILNLYICYHAHAIGIKRRRARVGSENHRIVLQTLTFTSGI